METREAQEQKDHLRDLDLQAEITPLTFEQFAVAALVSGIGIVGATAVLAGHFHDLWLWKLASVMAVVACFRISLPLAFEQRRNRQLTLIAASGWQMAHATGTALICGTVAVSTLYNFSHHDHTAQFISRLGVFSLCTGLGASFGLKPRAAQLCGLITLGALAWTVFLTTEPLLARTGCVLIGFFAVVYCKLVAGKYDMVVEQLRMKRAMSYLAEHDALTGLANRRQFEATLAGTCRQPGTFAVLFLDLDGFKKVNDTHGHAAGDALLQHVAQRLNQTVWRTDIVSRLGGDEFAILHRPQATLDSAEALARHILDGVSAPYSIDGHAILIGTSIGIQLSAPGRNDPNRLLSEADAALYQVKQAGKGAFRFVESPAAAVIAGSHASAPDAGQSAFGNLHHAARGRGKLLVGLAE